MCASSDAAEACPCGHLIFETVVHRGVGKVSSDSGRRLDLGLLLLVEHFVSLVTIGVDGSDRPEDREALAEVNVVDLQELREYRIQHLLL